MIGRFCLEHHLIRMQHFDVERKGDQAVKQPPPLGAHRVLVVAKVWKRVRDESVEHIECLLPMQRPGKLVGVWVAKALDASALYVIPNAAVVVFGPCVSWLRRISWPRFAVVLVEVPFAPDGLRRFSIFEEDAMLDPHLPVKGFHQPLFTSLKKDGCLVPGGVEMFAVHHLARDGLLLATFF